MLTFFSLHQKPNCPCLYDRVIIAALKSLRRSSFITNQFNRIQNILKIFNAYAQRPILQYSKARHPQNLHQA